MSNPENTNLEDMNLDDAIKLLRNAVKDSHLKNQKHLDLTLIDASEREKYQVALIIAQQAVKEDIISDSDLKKRLGLIEG